MFFGLHFSKYKLWGMLILGSGILFFSASLHYMFQSYQGQIQKDTPEKFFSRYDDVKDYEDKFWKIEVSPASADNAEAKIVFIQKKNTFSDNIKGIAYVVTKKDSLDDELPDYTARRLTK